ncbi:hypothetical protein [Halorubrum halophilum]|jgi:hypothetical protein|uniref:hypothetical protein n=1 Tax=Halorubrum halophilum TaxID=413816 RepID=UPI000678D1A7|nr:hypothetical protein [Halorubrum halophilum]
MANNPHERAKEYGLEAPEVNSLIPVAFWFVGRQFGKHGSIATSYEPELSTLVDYTFSEGKYAFVTRMQSRELFKTGNHYVAGRRCNWAPTETALQIMNSIFGGLSQFVPSWANDEHSGRPLCRDGGEHLHHRKGVLVAENYFDQLEQISHTRLYPNLGQQVNPDLLLGNYGDYAARVEVITRHNGYETWRKKFAFWDNIDDAPTVWVCESREHIVQMLNNLVKHEILELDGGRFGGDPSNWSQKRINNRLRRSGHSDSVITIPSMLEGDIVRTLEFVKDNNIISFS